MMTTESDVRDASDKVVVASSLRKELRVVLGNSLVEMIEDDPTFCRLIKDYARTVCPLVLDEIVVYLRSLESHKQATENYLQIAADYYGEV